MTEPSRNPAHYSSHSKSHEHDLYKSPQRPAVIVEHLRNYKSYADHGAFANSSNVKLMSLLEQWAIEKPAKNKSAFFIDKPRQTQTAWHGDESYNSIDTYYGGSSPSIFDAEQGPFRTIIAAGLQRTWLKAASAKFAFEVRGDIYIFFDPNVDLDDRAARRDDEAKLFLHNFLPVLRANPEVRAIHVIPNDGHEHELLDSANLSGPEVRFYAPIWH